MTPYHADLDRLFEYKWGHVEILGDDAYVYMRDHDILGNMTTLMLLPVSDELIHTLETGSDLRSMNLKTPKGYEIRPESGVPVDEETGEPIPWISVREESALVYYDFFSDREQAVKAAIDLWNETPYRDWPKVRVYAARQYVGYDFPHRKEIVWDSNKEVCPVVFTHNGCLFRLDALYGRDAWDAILHYDIRNGTDFYQSLPGEECMVAFGEDVSNYPEAKRVESWADVEPADKGCA